MPTPRRAFAVVAQTIDGTDPDNTVAVSQFYLNEFSAYPAEVKELISGFLIGHTDVPDEDSLQRLKTAVTEILDATQKRHHG